VSHQGISLPRTSRSAPVGVVVIGAGTMGRADPIRRSLASGKPIALP
jgi:hypothetical protein